MNLPLITCMMMVAVGAPTWFVDARSPTVTLSVTSGGGVLTGVELANGTVHAYLGVPYAQPPIGPLRWRSPQANLIRSPLTVDAKKPFCTQPDIEAGGFTLRPNSDEDCLYANIYSPAIPDPSLPPHTQAALPVVVYVHGGNLEVTDVVIDPTNLVANSSAIIYVTFEYRVNVFGFMAHPALSAERQPVESSGLFGFEDQQALLRWVQANIADFGGDPNRVTLQGHSAGSVSVCGHLIAPGSKGLFSAAILESGECDDQFIKTLAQAEQTTGGAVVPLFPVCNVADYEVQVSCLRNQTASSILVTVANASLTQWFGTGVFGVFVDGWIIPNDTPSLLKSINTLNDVPLLLGSVHYEFSPLFDPTQHLGLNSWFIPGGSWPVTTGTVSALSNQNQTLMNYYSNSSGVFNNPVIALNDALTTFAFGCSTRRTAQYVIHANSTQNVFMYSWDLAPLNSPYFPIPAHGQELSFLFGSSGAKVGWLNFNLTEAEQTTANSIQILWLRFIHNTNPNIPLPSAIEIRMNGHLNGSDVWSSYSDSNDRCMHFNSTTPTMWRMLPCGHQMACDLWDPLIPTMQPIDIHPRSNPCTNNMCNIATNNDNQCIVLFNPIGTYTCICGTGYQLNSNGTECNLDHTINSATPYLSSSLLTFTGLIAATLVFVLPSLV